MPQILPYSLALGILLASTVMFIVLAYRKAISSMTNASIFITFLLSFALLGWLSSCHYDIRNDEQWFGNHMNNSEGFLVEVIDKPAVKEKTVALNIRATGAFKDDSIYPAKGEAYAYVYKHDAPAYEEGDVLFVPNKWQEIQNSGNPHAFDYKNYLARKNIYHRQFLAAKDIQLIKYADERQLSFVRKIHSYSIEQFEYYIKDKHTVAILQAMLMGERQHMDKELRDAYSQTGIVHIIAISGAHIAIFFVVIGLLFGWIKSKRYKWMKYIAALPFIWLYVLVAGAPPSAVRAAVMFTILGIGFALQRNPNGYNQLFAAAFLLLFVNPMWLFDVGFQLSFIAVLSILIFYKPIRKLYYPQNVVVSKLWSAVAISIAAEVLVAPLVAYYFHSFPLFFLISNLIAYVVMGVVLVAGMLLLAVSSVPAFALVIADFIVGVTSVFNKIIFTLQHFNPDSFLTVYITAFQVILIYAIIGTLYWFLKNYKKQLLFSALILFTVFCATLLLKEWKVESQQKLVIYNTGKSGYIELISGNTYTPLHPVDITPEEYEYNVFPAHIAWSANKRADTVSMSDYFTLGNKKLLIWKGGGSYPDSMAADYVYINEIITVKEIDYILNTYEPSTIIMGNKISDKTIEILAPFTTSKGLEVHSIRDEGAFVAEAD